MEEALDYSEVPYLQEIINYLPINPEDKEDVVDYINNVLKLIVINYRYDQYQFAYFGVHLLYMTYIYCTVWKVSQMEPDRYKDAIVFARSYIGREKDLHIVDADSIFNYSLMPERDISKLFRIIDLDNTHIKKVRDLIEFRDNMAHASGKIDLVNEDSFEIKIHSIFDSIDNMHKSMIKLIKKWYSLILIGFCEGEYQDYDKAHDFISEYMIQNYKLSINELLICKDMSMKNLISEHSAYKTQLTNFKKAINKYCVDNGYNGYI